VRHTGIGDDHHLRAHLRRRRQLELEQADVLRRELDRISENGNGHVNGAVHDPVDAIRLRGVPVVGGGAAGAIRGSIPHLDAVENVDRRR